MSGRRRREEDPANRTETAVVEGYATDKGSRRLEVSYLTSSGLRLVDTVVTEREGDVVVHVRLEGLPGGRRFFDVRREIITVTLQDPLRDRRVIDERGRRVKRGIPRNVRDELLD